MSFDSLQAISPIDGRYSAMLSELQPLFSEFGFMRYRIEVEIRWFQTLIEAGQIKGISSLSKKDTQWLHAIFENFSLQDAQKIKEIEAETQHDVKAVEYFIKDKLSKNKKLAPYCEFVHFTLTSEDINNLAYGMILKTAKEDIIGVQLFTLIKELQKQAKKYAALPMLARTHGQPASPTTLGKELANFVARLKRQEFQWKHLSILGKCNGAVGNFNAHVVVDDEYDWLSLSEHFVNQLGLSWNPYTTQIEPHDFIAELSHCMMQINTILVDFCRDIWSYISLGYFVQKTQAKSIGSSTMPHKINPIDFENSEGNLQLANALFQSFANELPITRFQRDLSDSTMMRNIGVAFAHSLLAYKKVMTGLERLAPNKQVLLEELSTHWELLAEPIQMMMRRYQCPQAYEQLKALTRGKMVDRETLHQFIDQLLLPVEAKRKLKELTPENYLGLASHLAKNA
ncbi:MAG: adenylosuccinate lyase [Pseudomonadota bacterium]|nr:adenylosuccinate lyase [Gammaproteobacteria bacterium]MBU1628658.1 adenylosuccinate lyase [Gammaproteobacteria bacterium]MBU1926937.1 adenylosuccinate lyase [Gammaproteobacteria bacterium]MBU2545876.1 adenylosuccinate lyase [Gammaproteobacteria bacterium]